MPHGGSQTWFMNSVLMFYIGSTQEISNKRGMHVLWNRKDKIAFDIAPPPSWSVTASAPPWGGQSCKMPDKCPGGGGGGVVWMCVVGIDGATTLYDSPSAHTCTDLMQMFMQIKAKSVFYLQSEIH